MPFISDFHEINLRTYIDNDDKKGVYFLNIEAEKRLSSFIARSLSGLPYEKANIKRTNNTYKSSNYKKGFHLDTEYEVKNQLENKTDLDSWLTERYCLYLDKRNKLYHYTIHHKEWTIHKVELKRINLRYKAGDMNLSDTPPALAHYSDGVKVLAWKKEIL